MYTIEMIEDTLRSFNSTKANHKYLQMYLDGQLPTSLVGREGSNLNPFEIREKIDVLSAEIRMVEIWLSILNPEERLIVETHTIAGLDWPKTLVEHEKRWGTEHGRTQRTLMRMQARAMNKIYKRMHEW